MEILAATLIVSFLDPIRALITFGWVFVLRKSYGVLVATAASALVCEAILTFGQVPRVWGHDLFAGLIASLLQAVVLVLLSRAIQRRSALQSGEGWQSANLKAGNPAITWQPSRRRMWWG